MTTMPVILWCKRAIVSCGSLYVDLTTDTNLVLKNLPAVSTVGSISNGSRVSLTCLHLRQIFLGAYVCMVPSEGVVHPELHW
jgi:hypothetical protein